MSRKEDIPTVCVYCYHSTRIQESDACACEIHGIVRVDGCCKKFVFDILKYTPNQSSASKIFIPE